MIFEKVEKDWLKRSRDLLQAAATPHGIKASLENRDNYGAVFTRDAVMAGIAGVLLNDSVIIEGFKQSLIHLKKIQGQQGQIASNFRVKDGEIVKVSFGTLSPKIDSCTWYLVGVGLLTQEGVIEQEAFRSSVEKCVDLLEGIEYNGKHLVYVPKGGNWADEYAYEGYILYDQVLRAWGLSLVGANFGVQKWTDKSNAILSCMKEQYQADNQAYLNASFFPGGVFGRFDLAAHTLLGIVFGKEHAFVEQSLDWLIETFLENNKFPPAFYPTIEEEDPEWGPLSKYHLFAFKNKPHHYHNGGIWWIWIGWLSISLSLWDKKSALKKLEDLSFAYLNKTDHFEFDEYLAADDLKPYGTKQLCYTATGIIFLTLSKNNFDFSKLKIKEKPLINESIVLKEEYFELSAGLVDRLEQQSLLEQNKLVIGICGESGSGKSVTAKCLQIELEKRNINSLILHQDSYYRLAPKENHERRKSDISWVGTNELKIELLQSHIEQFKKQEEKIIVPIVDYEKNVFIQHPKMIRDKTVLIVEGVYAFLLEHLDYKVFMERTYQETLMKRKSRTREIYDPFVEKVLDIEHSIVQPLRIKADVIIKKDYSISVVDRK